MHLEYSPPVSLRLSIGFSTCIDAKKADVALVGIRRRGASDDGSLNLDVLLTTFAPGDVVVIDEGHVEVAHLIVDDAVPLAVVGRTQNVDCIASLEKK